MTFTPMPRLESASDFLDQKVFWRSQDGEIHVIEQMNTPHLRNLLPFLYRNAFDLLRGETHQWETALLTVNGDMATAHIESEIMALSEWYGDPQGWLARKPLLKAITRELSRREGLVD